MTMDFSAQRLSYEKHTLNEENLPNNPKILFEQWIKQAVDDKVVEPYAMSIATCGSDNLPSVRTVLMRSVTELEQQQFGLVFYTNYDSAKGIDIAQNPNVEALFFWHSLERQVRVSGQARKVSEQTSSNYFHKRPHDSQVAAWVSEPQSGIVQSRTVMEQRFDALQAQYPVGSRIPKPEFWGGYQIDVQEIEFWQGRANRMHDRILYSYTAKTAQNDPIWQMQRMLP